MGDWNLAPRSGSQPQGSRQNNAAGQKPNPQGRAESGKASMKELQDDASSPLKPGVGIKHDGEKSRKRSAHAISALAKNFVRARDKKKEVIRHGWQLPPAGLYKLNVDAVFSGDSGTGSTEAVLRDDRGTFIAGSCSGIPFAEDASSAVARALRDGLILASEVGMQKLVVESDCKEVIDTMIHDGNSLGPAAAVYEECSFLAKNFSSILFVFCPREANMVADTLAMIC
ncbi:retrotransposon expressed [Hordeum vulgare]|nr:retrotransposon expressed [Hordeum vulgare]